MSILEAARKMAAQEPVETDRGGLGVCLFCGEPNYRVVPAVGFRHAEIDHAEDCLCPKMPQIVKALEAAEHVVMRGSEDGAVVHVDRDDWSALVSALRGEP